MISPPEPHAGARATHLALRRTGSMIPWGAAVSRANIIFPISTTRSRRSGIPCIGDTLPVRILFTGGTRPSPWRRGPLRSGWLFLGECPGKSRQAVSHVHGAYERRPSASRHRHLRWHHGRAPAARRLRTLLRARSPGGYALSLVFCRQTQSLLRRGNPAGLRQGKPDAEAQSGQDRDEARRR